jgi:hypothetical protein
MSLAAVPSPRLSTALPAKPRRRSRAKPRPARPRLVVTAELRGLGGLVLEQALIDGTARPRPSLIEWTRRLSQELGYDDFEAVDTNRELMHAISAISRRAAAEPREMVALPAAA